VSEGWVVDFDGVEEGKVNSWGLCRNRDDRVESRSASAGDAESPAPRRRRHIVIGTSKTLQKRLSYGLLGLLLVYAVVRSTFAAAAKPLWYDELLTLTVASQPNWHAIIAALRAPLDGQPPLFHIIEKFAIRLARNEEISLRLPSILAMPCSLACVFVYAKKRWGELIALVCSSFLLMTMVFRYYAEEARPYSMVVACFAFALVCYQRA
jgi:hypothetical protein